MTIRLILSARMRPDGYPFMVLGREAWALLPLISVCTPINNPGLRWSAYVHAIRHEHGLDIETRHEAHNGPFPGNHALHSEKRCPSPLSQRPT